MQSTQSPIVENQNKQKTRRKPLQPKNWEAQQHSPHERQVSKKKTSQKWIEISLAVEDSNKENGPIVMIEAMDASLGEELSAMRKRLERMRAEKEKTERLLRERDLALEKAMRALEQNGRAQKRVEMEVELLKRLNELRGFWTLSVKPSVSLREMEREKQINEEPLMESERNGMAERVAEKSEIRIE